MVLMGSIHTLELTANTLREEVCGLLNNMGGVILYGCEREYFSVIAKGDRILQKDYHKIESEIRRFLSDITPLLEKEISISLVPVKFNPYTKKGNI
jgi:predicted HTH transcriptional regulator